jgi:VCBS repeat protein
MSDDFSSNTSTTGALAIGGSSLGNIERADDQDWFKVHLRGGVIYRFDAVGAGSRPLDDTTLEIFDSAGNTTQFFNDDANNSFFAELFFSPRADGDYFVDVGAFSTHTGGYEVSATIDDFAAGTSTSGRVTVNGGPSRGMLNQSSDEDWFAVDLVAGTHYDVRTTGADTTATLFDANGRELEADSISDFGASYTGRYYVDVSGFTNGGGANPTGPYTVDVVTANANGDFNANGHSDMLWRNANGELAQWSMDGGTITSGGDLTFNGLQVRPDPSWTIEAVTDFNFDGKADILWRGPNGQLVVWGMDGSTIASSGVVSLNGAPQQLDSSWNVAAVGDFSGGADGNETRAVLWRNSTTNQLLEWNIDGSNIVSENTSFPTPDKSWSVAGVGDFDGSTSDDIVWRSTSGEVSMWLMSDTEINASHDVTSGGTPVQVDPSWSMVGVGDFNDDGRADMLWRNAAGQISEWQMNGSVIASTGFITSQGSVVAPDATWHIVQIGDFNGDGQSDILWRSDSGAVAEWLMNGTQVMASVSPSLANTSVQPDASWQTQAKPTQFI